MHKISIIPTALCATAILLLSCENNKIDTPAARATTASASQHAAPATKQTRQFPAVLNGEWVLTEYIDHLAKTKSPVKSSDVLGGVVAIVIDLSKTADDTLEVGLNISDHEGDMLTLSMQPGHQPHSFKTNMVDYDNEGNFFELGYEVKGRDTVLVLYNYNRRGALFYKKEYTKVPTLHDDEGGVQFIARKYVIAGDYTVVDATGEHGTVHFDINGKVTGLHNFTTYYVITDFVVEGTNSADQLCFEIQTPRQQCYAFSLAGDTLRLYEETTNDNDEVSYGALRYTFVKQKEQ